MTSEQRRHVDALMRSGDFGGGSTPEEMRRSFAHLMAGMRVPEVRTQDCSLGGLAALAVDPVGGPSTPGTLLYFHGGAFVFGSPATALGLTASLVVGAGVHAVSVDYGLAPEHPFPQAIEDGVRAYRALLDSGAAPASIAFAGDSAGGNLTITVMLAARDAGLPMPACGIAFSPSLDATRSGESMDTREGIDPIFTRRSLEAAEHLYRPGQDPAVPLLSPAIVGELAGLPPLLLQTGSNEVLLDDSVRFAARAAAADVDVVLDVTADVPHVFPSFIGVLDEADRAMERASLFLRQQLTR